MARPKKSDSVKRTRQASIQTLIKKRDKLQAEIDAINAKIEERKKAEEDTAAKKKLLAELNKRSLDELQKLIGE